MAVSILPPNATQMELSIEATTDRLPSPAVIAQLNDPYTCPAAFLPYLAWARDVLDWKVSWPVEKQRAVIATSIPVHNVLGTAGALKQALIALGYSAVEIIEQQLNFRNGSIDHSGIAIHGSKIPAYQFDVQLNTGASPTASEITEIKRVIDIYKNVRSHLMTLRYMTLHHNGAAVRDGSNTRDGGVIYG